MQFINFIAACCIYASHVSCFAYLKWSALLFCFFSLKWHSDWGVGGLRWICFFTSVLFWVWKSWKKKFMILITQLWFFVIRTVMVCTRNNGLCLELWMNGDIIFLLWLNFTKVEVNFYIIERHSDISTTNGYLS